VGALTSWGLNALYSPAYAYSSLGYYPSAWSAPVYGSWGMESVATDWMYAGYENPYVTPATQTVVVQQPAPVAVAGEAAPAAQPVVAYDYANPIGAAAAPPEPTAAESAQKVFESARDSFKAGDYGRALALADQALAMLPQDPVLHEFRALCLFALKRFDEAAAVDYAVLSAGPSWDWSTLVGLYPSVEAYTDHLRALEAAVNQNPTAPAPRFLLAYFYLVQGDKEAAATRFSEVSRLQPQDKLSAKLASALARGPGAPAQAAPVATAAAPTAAATQPAAPAATAAPAENAPPPAPPAALAGTWVAKPDPKVTISLVLKPEGTFTWAVTQGGRTQTIQGQAGYQDDVLVLGQEQGPPLTGKVALRPDNGSFTFTPPGAPQTAAGLTFVKETG
jgi:tetratricopeptide (TPR) repeat protein